MLEPPSEADALRLDVSTSIVADHDRWQFRDPPIQVGSRKAICGSLPRAAATMPCLLTPAWDELLLVMTPGKLQFNVS